MTKKTDEELMKSNPRTLTPDEYKRLREFDDKHYTVTISKVLTKDQEERIMEEIVKTRPDWFQRMVEVERAWIRKSPHDEALTFNIVNPNKNFLSLAQELDEVATQLNLSPSEYVIFTVWGKFHQLAHDEALKLLNAEGN